MVDPKDAPYIIFVQGTVQNAKGYHTYLVVNDYYHENIEPISGFGKNVDQNFSGFCYLGKMRDSSSVNKLYSISGVVTTKEYEEYNHLDR
ncbi:MAG: hypothetical protein JSW07_22020 [bacterium]|nr:MAG: hypothetical protein JSW07_22020 [bacterium]